MRNADTLFERRMRKRPRAAWFGPAVTGHRTKKSGREGGREGESLNQLLIANVVYWLNNQIVCCILLFCSFKFVLLYLERRATQSKSLVWRGGGRRGG